MEISDDSVKQKVVVVGAGPVGALAALYAANRGDNVEVYELRGDLRDPDITSLNFTKTINLALSERGINSIRNARCHGLLDEILKETIPMRGRMIHGQEKDGKLIHESQEYDPHGRCIQAADRAALNKSILDSLETMPNVKLHFNHKLTGANFNSKTAWFEQQKAALTANNRQNQTQNDSSEMDLNRPPEISVDFDLLIGADGAHSAARYHMMKYARVNYQQEYIDTLWCEFRIDPKQPGLSFAISPNHLHIWPGRSSMFIAVPSFDKSFTCTLFASSSDFARLSACPVEELLSYFMKYFPGVCPDLISTNDLQEQFRKNPHLPLISIKCSPYHYKSSVVILGDAAHAMVPFYGQGMNSGLEDVRILFESLDHHGVYESILHGRDARENLRAEALEYYTMQRVPDAATINDLAVRNYQEMRSDVQSPLYRIRKLIEEKVDLYLPRLGWKTQYSRVSFENERFTEVKKAVFLQGRILTSIIGLGALGLGGLISIGLSRSGFVSRVARFFFRQK